MEFCKQWCPFTIFYWLSCFFLRIRKHSMYWRTIGGWVGYVWWCCECEGIRHKKIHFGEGQFLLWLNFRFSVTGAIFPCPGRVLMMKGRRKPSVKQWLPARSHTFGAFSHNIWSDQTVRGLPQSCPESKSELMSLPWNLSTYQISSLSNPSHIFMNIHFC